MRKTMPSAFRVLCGLLLLWGCGEEPSNAGLPPLTDPLDLGDPIDVPDTVWTWVDFPETRCMDGSPSGLGIWRNPESPKVLIYIQGGGACFNTSTCFLVANPMGFHADNLEAAVSDGVMSNSDASNPFASWNKVFIPYCSGDNFTGAAADGTGFGGRTQVGYRNIRNYLERLVPTFASHDHVVLGGYSAGGIAASINSVQVIEAFGQDVRVDVLNDSGAMFTEKYLAPCMQARMAERWHSQANLPADCADCDPAAGHILEPILAWAAPRLTNVRQAFISSDGDSIMRQFMGFGANECAGFDDFVPMQLTAEEFSDGLVGVRERFANNPNYAIFQITGTQHVWTQQSPASVTSAGVSLSDWLSAFIDPNAAHVSVVP